jgi:hypothetical protein
MRMVCLVLQQILYLWMRIIVQSLGNEVSNKRFKLIIYLIYTVLRKEPLVELMQVHLFE